MICEWAWAVVVKKTGRIHRHGRDPMKHVHKTKRMAEMDLKLQGKSDRFMLVEVGIAELRTKL